MIDGLDADERRAWQGLLAVMLVGIPQVERAFRAHGLVQIEYGLLNVLDAGPRRLSELAGQTNVSLSRLSHRMSKLAERGYVRVRPDGCDGRVSVAEITDDGRALIEVIAPVYARALREVLFDHLTPEQTAALADAMQAVGTNLGACLEEH
ncbi:MarR family transcriptional regulator [Nonomuraea sp. NBC_01738]|uniref:MarR family winged helix-turn-helix transcriptional regulator n=1 Tax=Nonomuraea sp. NBC_01738 TaxID=2976003 RepID=UPI002E15BD17|nr:MarR family transcriptional regulator [Nonomuraea sp. NBC_01738]